IQLKQNPFRHFGGGGIDEARQSGVVQVDELDKLKLPIHFRMRPHVVVAGLETGIAEICNVHSQETQNFFANVVFPGFPDHCKNDLPYDHVQKVVVNETAAETGGRLHEAQLIDDFSAGENRVRPEEQVAFAQAHAATVSQKIADGHLVRDIQIV